ncbi:MAG: hypothetical protein PHS88_03950 [Candidatus Omnitrophica bacterium]|nr:hypothetical protein [Candidatus Omnitrophota bacterium]
MISLTRKQILLVLFLALAVLGVQMVRITRPYTGHFATYQGTVMASIAQNLLRENFKEPLRPKTNTLIAGERSLHMNQYPVPSVIAAVAVHFRGGTLEFWGRFQAICFNAFSIVLVGLIAACLFGPLTGWIAAAVFALSPYTILYGQAFLSEPCALFFLLAAVYLLVAAPAKRLSLVRIILSALSFSVAVAGRVHWVLFTPLPAFILLCSRRSAGFKTGALLLFGLLSFTIPVAWYAYTYDVGLNAANIHTNIFMQVSSGGAEAKNLLTHADYYRQVFDLVSGMMMTPLVFPFLLLGVYVCDKKSVSFWSVGLGALVGVLIVFAAPQKVLKHDFYLYGVFPFLAIFAACGLAPVLRAFPALRSTSWMVVVLLIYFAVSGRYFLHPVFKSPPEEMKMVQVAEIVRENTGPDERIIVIGEGPGVFIHYVRRGVWPLQPSLIGGKLSPYQKVKDVNPGHRREATYLERAMQNGLTWFEYLRDQGADYLVAPDKKVLEQIPELNAYLQSHYQSLAPEQSGYSFYRLKSPTEPATD